MSDAVYTKEEGDDFVNQINELKSALSACWYLLPDGEYGSAGIAIKKTIQKFHCWPDEQKAIGLGWQAIDCAPFVPGSVVLIYAPSSVGNDGTVGEAFLAEDSQWYWSGCDANYHDPIAECNAPPTHWMPLPKPPKH